MRGTGSPSQAWLLAGLVVAMSGGPGCDKASTEPPSPPGGGQTADLSFTEFVSVVDPILRVHGCDAEGDCHGGGIRGTFQLSPPGAKDPAFDFQQTAQQVNAADPTASLILTEPLDEAAGGTAHADPPFATTDDENYQAILAWIEAGVQ